MSTFQASHQSCTTDDPNSPNNGRFHLSRRGTVHRAPTRRIIILLGRTDGSPLRDGVCDFWVKRVGHRHLFHCTGFPPVPPLRDGICCRGTVL